MNVIFLILINLVTLLLSNSQFSFQADGELLEYQEDGVLMCYGLFYFEYYELNKLFG